MFRFRQISFFLRQTADRSHFMVRNRQRLHLKGARIERLWNWASSPNVGFSCSECVHMNATYLHICQFYSLVISGKKFEKQFARKKSWEVVQVCRFSQRSLHRHILGQKTSFCCSLCVIPFLESSNLLPWPVTCHWTRQRSKFIEKWIRRVSIKTAS